MGLLPEPVEILDLNDMGKLTTKVLKWEEGEITIVTGQFPGGKVVQVARLHVPKDQKTHFPYYWDVTSKTLRAQLLPLLDGIVRDGRTIIVTKHGIAPSARFTLELT